MDKKNYLHLLDEWGKRKTPIDEDEDAFSIDECLVQDLDNTVLLSTINLSSLSESEKQNLKVSLISFFGSIVWDWRQEGSPVYRDKTFFNWDRPIAEGTSLNDTECVPLLRLLRHLLFYNLPQNDLFGNIRSFNSSVNIAKQILDIGKCLFSIRAYVDLLGNGCYRTVSDIPREEFVKYIETLTPYSRYSFARQMNNWFKLSENHLLPLDLQLNFKVFDDFTMRKLLIEFDNSKVPFLPISLDTLETLVPYCCDIIENHSSDILKVFEMVWPALAGNNNIVGFDWTDTIIKLERTTYNYFKIEEFITPQRTMDNKEADTLRNAIWRHPDWPKHTAADNYRNKTEFNRVRHGLLYKYADEIGIVPEDLSLLIKYSPALILHKSRLMCTELRNACAVIIFLTTGMRRSEFVNLEVGNYWKVKNSNDDYRLRFKVFKTSNASEGDVMVIPIPKITFEALLLMERFSKHARKSAGSKYIWINVTTQFAKIPCVGFINDALTKWSLSLGLNEIIHPHQFRKTLAMFAVYHDVRNISLIRYLFSHKSLAMTLAYIVKLPGMSDEIRYALVVQNKELLAEILEAVELNTIGGKAGCRIKKSMQPRISKSKLKDDAWESLEDYVDLLLDEGATLLHRGELGVICTNNHPLLGPFVHKTCDCNVVDCDYAVFTDKSIRKLSDDINFHKKLIIHPYSSKDQIVFSKRQINSALERLAELQGEKVVKYEFNEVYKLCA